MAASVRKVRRCLIRHRPSQAYYGEGRWTKNPHEAKDFCDLREVAEVCVRFGLRDVDIVFRGQSEELDVAIRLR